jgi:hypothetical protein
MGAAPTPPAAVARCLARAARVQAPGRAPAGPLVAMHAASFHSTASDNGGESLSSSIAGICPIAATSAGSPGSSAVGRAADSHRPPSSSGTTARATSRPVPRRCQPPAPSGGARQGDPSRNRSTAAQVGSAGIAAALGGRQRADRAREPADRAQPIGVAESIGIGEQAVEQPGDESVAGTGRIHRRHVEASDHAGGIRGDEDAAAGAEGDDHER